MKRLLGFIATFALIGTQAFGQFQDGGVMFSPLGTQVYLQEGKASGSEAAGLFDLIRREIDKSRTLHRVAAAMEGQPTMEIEAPVTFVKSADGARITVTYEVTPATGLGGRVFTTTCTSTQLYRCAQDIAARAERMGREGARAGF